MCVVSLLGYKQAPQLQLALSRASTETCPWLQHTMLAFRRNETAMGSFQQASSRADFLGRFPDHADKSCGDLRRSAYSCHRWRAVDAVGTAIERARAAIVR